MLTIDDVLKVYPSRLPLNQTTLGLANEAMDRLWEERLKERGREPSDDRSGSCKFASLLARQLFGGSLDGNYYHVFVRRKGKILDLNEHQKDVAEMDGMAHDSMKVLLTHRDYRESLGSCMPRVLRWEAWVRDQYRALEKNRSGTEMSM